jgi:hypothetical protein
VSQMESNLGARMQSILDDLPDPRNGLPDAVFEFVRKVTPLVNVDLLVQDIEGRTLMAWREDEYGVGWHIPGGIVRFFEQASHRIAAVADRELGAEVEAENDPCDVVQYFIPRGHFISLLYRCKLRGKLGNAHLLYGGGKPRNGVITWITGIPEELYPVQTPYKRWLRKGANGGG